MADDASLRRAEPGPAAVQGAGSSGAVTFDRSRSGLSAGLEWVPTHPPGWLTPHGGENRVPAAAAILVAAGLQLLPLLPVRWLLPSLELLLVVTLIAVNPVRLSRHSPAGRPFEPTAGGAYLAGQRRQCGPTRYAVDRRHPPATKLVRCCPRLRPSTSPMSSRSGSGTGSWTGEVRLREPPRNTSIPISCFPKGAGHTWPAKPGAPTSGTTCMSGSPTRPRSLPPTPAAHPVGQGLNGGPRRYRPLDHCSGHGLGRQHP